MEKLAAICVLGIALIQTVQAANRTEAVKVGCYKENKRYRNFRVSPGGYTPSSVTPNACAQACSNYDYKYAAIAQGKYCFCAHTLELTEQNNTGCPLTCVDGSECGGFDFVTVYEIGGFITSLSLDVSDVVVPVKQTVAFSISITSDLQVDYQFDYGDGAGFTDKNGTGIYSKSFEKPGEYEVLLLATDTSGSGQEKRAMAGVLVHEPVGRVDLQCPDADVINHELECNATVQSGTSLVASVNYADNIIENFTIADPGRFYAGPPIPEKTTPSAGLVSGTLVMQASEFKQDGTLTAFEFHATGSGAVKFLILKPLCTGGCYSYEDNTCQATGTCSDPNLYQCTGATFCPAAGICSPGCNVPNRYTSPNPQISNYEVLYAIDYTISSAGYSYITTPQEVDVKKGYILGFHSTSAVLGTVDSSPNEGDFTTGDFTTQGDTLSTFAYVSGGVRHLLKAVIVQPVQLKIRHTYAINGLFEMVLTVSNKYIVGSQIARSNISIGDGIDNIILNTSACFEVGKPVRVEIMPHGGDGVSYTWDWGDAVSPTEDTTVLFNTHTYTLPKRYNVTVTAKNLLSEKTNFTEVCVEVPVSGITITSNPSASGDQANISFSVAAGSDYTCDWQTDGYNFTTNGVDHPTGSIQQHQYNTAGSFLINIVCYNMLSLESKQITHVVQDRITGLTLTKKGALKGEDYRLEWMIATGTDPTFNATIENESPVCFYNAATKSGHSAVITNVDDTGMVTVTLQAVNLISQMTIVENFTIEVQISGVRFNCSKSAVPMNDPVDFEVRMDDGSGVTILIDYDDSNIQDTFSHPSGYTWLAGDVYQRTHSFITGGRKTVKLTVSNGVEPTENRNCTIDVITPIADIIMRSNSPVIFTPPGQTEIYFEQKSGVPPAVASVKIDFGDGTVEPFTFDMARRYEHVYVEVGKYKVRAEISNSVDLLVVKGDVEVVEPVVELTVTANPPHASFGEEVELIVTMFRGCGSDVNLYWDFGDSNYDSGPEEGTCPYGKTIKKKTYNALGPQVVSVRAENDLGNTSAEYTIHSQIPVKSNFFKLEVSGQNTWDPGTGTVDKTFTLLYSGVNPDHYPTDATILLDFGDGTWIEELLPAKTAFPSVLDVHSYGAAGSYLAKLTIHNLASSHVFEAQAEVIDPITNLAVEVVYYPIVPNSPPLKGYGVSFDTFPLDRSVTFNVTMTKGTVVTYKFDASSPSQTISGLQFTSNPFEVKLNKEETYSITIKACNLLEEIPVTKTVIMKSRNLGLQITDRNIITASSENKSFDITLHSKESDSCLIINYGDSSTEETLGNPTLCTLPDKRYISDFSPNVTNRIYHKYWEIGTFTISVTPSSSVFSYIPTTFQFPVSYVVCRSPAIDILDRTPVFYEPREVKKSQIFRVIGTTDLNCTKTFENIKTWQVWRVNPNDGSVIEEIDVTSLDSSKKAELAVQEKFLRYGLYKISYRVEMDSTKFPYSAEFSGSADTYIKVVKTDLIGNLIKGGMSKIKIQWGTELKLEPGLYSIDPDLKKNEAQEFDSFTWFCRKIGDRGYPKMSDGSYNISFATMPLTNVSAYTEDRGGCFRQGPGPIGFTKKTASINTVQFDANATYEFMVILTKDTRTVEAKLNVSVTANPVPYVIIECKTKDLCQQIVGAQKVNPSARLALVGKCSGECDNVHYKWEGLSFDYKWPYKTIPDFEKYTQGIGSPEIAIEKGLFAAFPNVSKFRIDLSVWEDGGEHGQSQIIIEVNQPPSQGTCTLSGNTGEVLSPTKTVIHCQDWKDEDGVTTYQFFVLFKDDAMEHHLVFGKDATVEVQLPLGPDWDDFMMDVYARIYDSLGAHTTLHISREKVQPSSIVVLDELVGNLLSGADDRISLTAAKADLLESCYTFQTLASALNSASKASVSEYHNTSVSAAQTPTGYGPGGVTKSHAESVNPDLEQAAKEEKDDRARLREQMISGIRSVTTSNVASVALKASAVNSLAVFPDELTRKAQVDMAEVLVDCANALTDLSEVTTKEELIAAGTNIMAGAGTLLVAAKYHYKDPLLSDLAEASELDVYDTNRESPDEAIVSLDPVEGRAQLTSSTNKNIQKETADSVVDQIITGIKEVSAAVQSYLVPGEEPVIIVTDQLALSLEKNHASKLSNRTIDPGHGSVSLPDWCTLQANDNCSTTEVINLEVITTPSVPYGLTENAANLTFSGGIEINFVREDGSMVDIMASQEDIEIIIPRDTAAVTGKSLSADPDIVQPWEYLYFHKSSVESKNSSVHLQFRLEDPTVQYLVFVRYEDFPNITEGKWDFIQPIPHKMGQAGTFVSADTADPYTLFISNDQVPANWQGDFFVGVRQLLPEEYDTYSTSSVVTAKTWTSGSNPFTGNYSLKIYTSSCVYYDEKLKDWFTDGCRVGKLTTVSQTQCFCNHLTTFAGGLIVAPNSIDWNFVFSNADFLNNPTLYTTEIVIAVLYILAMIWARRKDKKDVQEVGITPLTDNDPQDKYYYEIVVQTGLRGNAGTDSKVHFILSGEYEETDVRPLTDPKRKTFRRGGSDGFLLAVARPLGPLNFVRIWHDNSGKGKFGSWYLKYFLVRDLQTGEKFYFLCNKWFAVEEGDGQVDRVCPVAGPEQMMQFGHQFSQKTRRNMSDGHLWFSVIARPPRSRFTRVQRVSCCLCLLFLTMFANAMYYEKDDATGTGSFTFGPFALTPAQLSIGVLTNLIVFPISFIIIELFRKSRPRKKRPSRIKEAIQKSGVKLSDINPQMGSKWSLQQQELNMPDRTNPEYRDDPTPRPGTAVSSISNFRSETPMSGRISNTHYNMQKKKRDKAKTKRMLPWWCQIIGWILLWISVGVSFAFTTFYGIGFGEYKCKEWITSMMVAFIMSIFITQPIKVFLTAVVLSLIIRNPGEDDDEGDEDEEDPYLGTDEEYLHRLPMEGYGRPKKVAYKPPDPHILEKARQLRLNEIKMWNVIREIVFYAFFLWILMVISYGNRDPLSYLYKYSLERNFIGNNITSSDFRQVHNTKNFWNWTVNSLVPSIRAGEYYNGDPPLYLRGYINDKASRIMGYATMRQLRISKGTCRMEPAFENVIESCNGDYRFWNEEKGSYGTSWTALNGSTPLKHYSYRNSASLDGYPYWGRLSVYNGGGYVVELRESKYDLLDRMKELEAEGWVDKYTRAVFIEFTVYNPGINLFAVATLLAEWHPSAGIIASYRFEPVRLFTYLENAALFQIICEVAFLLFIIFFIYREVRCIMKEKGKYLHNFWNMVEISIVGVSIASVVIYFYRLIVSNQLTSVFKETHGNEYMKFQYVGYWNEILSYLIGWLVFLSTIKFLKLLRFNRRMSILAATLKNGYKSMFHFGIVFTIVFLAFIQLFYLVYHTNIYTFANFVNSMEAGFLMMMGKFDIYSMMMMEPLITPVFFCLFVVTITFILVNMFVSILNESFSSVQHDISKQPNEYEIVDFMLGRFKQWTGIGGAPPPTSKSDDILLNNLKGEKGNGKPPVEHFPDKVDELLNTISKAYFDQDNLENVLGPKTDADRMAVKNLLKKHAESNKRPLSATRTDKVANIDPNTGQYRRF